MAQDGLLDKINEGLKRFPISQQDKDNNDNKEISK